MLFFKTVKFEKNTTPASFIFFLRIYYTFFYTYDKILVFEQ